MWKARWRDCGVSMVPEEIKTLRRKLGLTQAALAARLGCRQGTVSDWERGIRKPQPVFVRAMRALEREG